MYFCFKSSIYVYRTKAHEERGAGDQRGRRDQVQEGAVPLSHLWQGELPALQRRVMALMAAGQICAHK